MKFQAFNSDGQQKFMAEYDGICWWSTSCFTNDDAADVAAFGQIYDEMAGGAQAGVVHVHDEPWHWKAA